MIPGATRALAGAFLAAVYGLLGCGYQTDLVALRRTRELCQAQDACVPPSAATDTGPAPRPSCDASEGCSSSSAGCSDAASCAPPAAKPTIVERCLARACTENLGSDTFCERDGLAIILGDSCTSADSNPAFRHAICSQTDLIVKAPLRVQGNVSVDRDLTVGGQIVVEGDLHYAGRFVDAGGAQPQANTSTQSDPECDPKHALQLDIAAQVKAAAASNDNDRALPQLAQLTRWTGQQSITLPCGRYYLTDIDGDGGMDIQAAGHVVLFIDGGVSVKAGLTIHAAPGARVTVVVNGSLHVIGGLRIGDLADARHMLISAKQAHLEQGANAVGGLLYVQSEELLLVNGTLDVKGALFAYRAQLEGATSVASAPTIHATANAGCNP